VLGHSERRACFGETDRALALKVPAALEAGLRPILCVGETEEERDNDDTERKLRQQVWMGLRGGDERLAEVTIAYERLGDRTGGWRARSRLRRRSRSSGRSSAIATRAAESVRILYGARSSGERAELLGLADVDGALVGGASLDAECLPRSWPPPRDELLRTRGVACGVCLVVLDGWGLGEPGPVTL